MTNQDQGIIQAEKTESSSQLPVGESSNPEAYKYKEEGILLPPVVPNIREWPIAKLLKNPKTFVTQVKEESIYQLEKKAEREGLTLHQLVEQTMYMERNRMYEDPWKVDPKDEAKFWRTIRKNLIKGEQHIKDPESVLENDHELLDRIVGRYAKEISSTFRPSTYNFAKRVLPFIFSTLLNASAGKTIRSVIKHRIGLQEKVHLVGQVESIRNLSRIGTIVLVPTHISNLDSIMVGWGLHALGLPAFIYGAGLNLFNNKILSYFMNRIGAYTVDRRKKNPLYRTTLNAYSTLAIQNNCHSLFFPGGTRSRNGEIEKKLKLGLLGTAMEAQRRNFVPGGSGKKVFIVPMVMSYHFVLEAKSLIRQHLTRTGQEQYYIIDDEFASYRKFLMFIWKTFGATSDITLNFGKPMDMFGNFVDDNGTSFDSRGRIIDTREYFMTRGEFTADIQRDGEYTRMLGERLVERYHAENYVFSSHVVAFVAFEMLKRKYPQLDLYALLRLPEDDRKISLESYLKTLDQVLARMRHMASQSKLIMAEHLQVQTKTLVDHGIKNLGLYHSKRPLSYQDEQTLTSENLNLLYYYHNRLVGYGLEAFI